MGNLVNKLKNAVGWESTDIPDDGQVRDRQTGGVENPEYDDQGSTTGTTPNGTPVGRVSGQDTGYEGETGAERRAAAQGQDDATTTPH